MKRKIYQTLLDWKRKDHEKVFLLIDGARRVGKSWIVEEFAKREYESHIIIDFNEVNLTVREFFTEYLHDLDDFYMRLEAFFGVKLIPDKSLVVFAVDVPTELEKPGMDEDTAAAIWIKVNDNAELNRFFKVTVDLK